MAEIVIFKFGLRERKSFEENALNNVTDRPTNERSVVESSLYPSDSNVKNDKLYKLTK